MATLTSAGAVNLTSSTNWSPAQIPQAGDDLIIGAHTLTLDADFSGVSALGSITFNNVSAKLAFSGASRTVDFTNGLTVYSASGLDLFSASTPSSGNYVIRGTWKRSGNLNSTLGSMVRSSGANITLATIGDDPGAVLIEGYAGFTGIQVITSTWTGGTLTTIGRFDLASWTASAATLVTMSGGLWSHTNTGTSLLGAGGHQVFNGSGTSGINWSGDITSASTVTAAVVIDGGAGASSYSGTLKRTASSPAATVNSLPAFLSLTGNKTVTITGMICVPVTSRAVSMVTAGSTSACRINWRSQSRTIPSTDAVIIVNGASAVVDMTSLTLSNAGRFVYFEIGSAQAVVDSSTLITNTTTSAQACVVSNSGALDGKVVNLSSDILRIPTADEVAADADPFGYTASPITPTGLVVDPAVLAAAVGTALGAYDTNGVASRDDLADVGVDLTPVLAKLPVSGRALSDADYTPGGLTPEQETLLEDTKTATDSIATAIAGGSPVEPTGTTVFEHLEQIQDSIDTYIASVTAVNGSSGTIIGFPETLTIGNSYTTDGGNAIHVFIRDENDDPITSVGTHDFTDPDFSCDLIITNSGNAGRVRATVTYVDPGVAESYLKVEIPLSESSRAAAGAATMQCTLKWDGVAKTIATQTVTWVARI